MNNEQSTITELNLRIDELVNKVDVLVAEIQSLSAQLQAVIEDNEKLTQHNIELNTANAELTEQLSERPTVPDFAPSKLAVLVGITFWTTIGYTVAQFI